MTLDSWDLETLSIMKRLGNVKVNRFLEFKLPANQKLESSASPGVRNEFIRRKYVDRKWAADSVDFCAHFATFGMDNPQTKPVDQPVDQIDIQRYFVDNVRAANFGGVLASITAGADPNAIGKFRAPRHQFWQKIFRQKYIDKKKSTVQVIFGKKVFSSQ